MRSIGIIGTGRSAGQHAEALQASAHFSIDAVFDIDGDKAQAFAAAHGAQCVSVEQMFDQCDVVTLCLPPGLRDPYLDLAADHSAMIVVEKPLFLNGQRLDLLQAAGARVFAMYQHRLGLEPVLASVELPLDQASASVWVNRPRTREQLTSAWRTDRRIAGGGILTHIGVHYLDLVGLLLGDVRGVQVETRADYPRALDTRVAGVVEFERGNVLSFIVGGIHAERVDRIGIHSERLSMAYDGRQYQFAVDGQSHAPLDVASPAELRRQWYDRLAAAIDDPEPGMIFDPRLSLRSHQILEEVARGA